MRRKLYTAKAPPRRLSQTFTKDAVRRISTDQWPYIAPLMNTATAVETLLQGGPKEGGSANQAIYQERGRLCPAHFESGAIPPE